jgi:hypothetical protein
MLPESKTALIAVAAFDYIFMFDDPLHGILIE